MNKTVKELIAAVAEYKALLVELDQKKHDSRISMDQRKFIYTSLKILDDYIYELAENISDLTALSSEVCKFVEQSREKKERGDFVHRDWLLEPNSYNNLEQKIKARVKDSAGKKSEDERAEHRLTPR